MREVLLLGGMPIREPVTRDEIITAIEDFNAGRMGSVPATHLTGKRLGE